MRCFKRNSARKRKYYRLIADEKKRLLLSGVDPEELRLFCRHLANPHNAFAIKKGCKQIALSPRFLPSIEFRIMYIMLNIRCRERRKQFRRKADYIADLIYRLLTPFGSLRLAC